MHVCTKCTRVATKEHELACVALLHTYVCMLRVSSPLTRPPPWPLALSPSPSLNLYPPLRSLPLKKYEVVAGACLILLIQVVLTLTSKDDWGQGTKNRMIELEQVLPAQKIMLSYIVRTPLDYVCVGRNLSCLVFTSVEVGTYIQDLVLCGLLFSAHSGLIFSHTQL